jgi:hypothetical protein
LRRTDGEELWIDREEGSRVAIRWEDREAGFYSSLTLQPHEARQLLAWLKEQFPEDA